jgi:hypothetical protein
MLNDKNATAIKLLSKDHYVYDGKITPLDADDVYLKPTRH